MLEAKTNILKYSSTNWQRNQLHLSEDHNEPNTGDGRDELIQVCYHCAKKKCKQRLEHKYSYVNINRPVLYM